MLGIKLLLVVATLATNARAAFFYCPEYLSGPGGSCPGKESKRAVDTDDEPLSLNIIQRLPKDDSPPNIELIAGSLRRKYQRTANVDTANLENGNVVKRTNTHSIVTAAMPSQTNSAGVDQDGTDYSYFAEVKLGSSNTPVYMLLDTGAGNTWVMGSSCTTDSCKTHDTFNPSDSKTFKDLAQPFSVSYGSGSVAGSLGQDTLSFAGITLTGATVGIVSNASSQFNSFPFEGILGLSLSKSDGKTFWETLAESKALKSNLVGFAINRNSDGPNTGVVNFGSPDSSRFSGSLSYFPSLPNDSDDWAVQLTDVGFGSTQIGISSIAYIDTGTSFIFAPPADAKKLHAAIDGAKVSSDGSSYSVPCTTTTPLTFSFGSSTYSVSSKDWVSAKVNGVCTSNVYAMGVVDGSSWLVGDTFLKNVYTVFDYDQTRLGFAPKEAASASSTAASSSATGGLSSSTITSSKASSTPSITGISTSTNTGTSSNGISAGTSSGSTSVQSTLTSVTGTSSSEASSTGSPGLNGHETPSSTTESAPAAGKETTAASASSTKKSSAILLNPNIYSALLAAGTLITLLL